VPADVDDIVVLNTTTDFPEMTNVNSAGDPIDTPYPGLDRTKYRDAAAWNALIAAFVVVQEALAGIKAWLFGAGTSEIGGGLADADSILLLDATDGVVKRALLNRITAHIVAAIPIASGTWTSAGVATTNIDTIGSISGYYVRVLDRVLAFGQVAVDPTAAAFTRFGMPVPVASNFGGVTDAVAWVGGEGTTSGRAAADATNDRLDCVYTTNSAASNTQYLIALYRVI
jgi:hypothetical protein